MNKSIVSIIALSSLIGASTQAATKAEIGVKIDMFCKEFLSQLSSIGNVSSTMEMRNLVGEIDTFVRENSSDDKDLLVPWATMKQSIDVMLTYSDLWSKLVKTNFDNATLKSNITKVAAATSDAKAAISKIGKTTFIRPAKRDVATMLKYFGEYEVKIGEKLHNALMMKCNQVYCNSAK